MSVPLFAISLTADGAVSTIGTPVTAEDVDEVFGATVTVVEFGALGFDAPGVTVEDTDAGDSLEAATSVYPLHPTDPVPSAAAVELEDPDTSSGADELPISKIE